MDKAIEKVTNRLKINIIKNGISGIIFQIRNSKEG